MIFAQDNPHLGVAAKTSKRPKGARNHVMLKEISAT